MTTPRLGQTVLIGQLRPVRFLTSSTSTRAAVCSAAGSYARPDDDGRLGQIEVGRGVGMGQQTQAGHQKTSTSWVRFGFGINASPHISAKVGGLHKGKGTETRGVWFSKPDPGYWSGRK